MKSQSQQKTSFTHMCANHSKRRRGQEQKHSQQIKEKVCNCSTWYSWGIYSSWKLCLVLGPSIAKHWGTWSPVNSCFDVQGAHNVQGCSENWVWFSWKKRRPRRNLISLPLQKQGFRKCRLLQGALRKAKKLENSQVEARRSPIGPEQKILQGEQLSIWLSCPRSL